MLVPLHNKAWCNNTMHFFLISGCYYQSVLNIGLIRMNILMLDTRNVEQTKDVHMYIEEFILVDIWIHWS